MKTVLLGERPAEIESFLARRRALGQDLYDEVWEGDYHVAPASHSRHGYLDNVLAVLLDPHARRAGLVGTGAFNLGDGSDYRVPDRGYHRGLPSGVWLPSAAIVVEIVSPDDETWEKFDFYARHGVDEICVADPAGSQLQWFALGANEYEETAASGLLNVAVADLAAKIDWPG